MSGQSRNHASIALAAGAVFALGLRQARPLFIGSSPIREVRAVAAAVPA